MQPCKHNWHFYTDTQSLKCLKCGKYTTDPHRAETSEVAHMDVHSHPAEFAHLTRNDAIEEVAVELETKFALPFGRDTVQSFAQYIRGMKR